MTELARIRSAYDVIEEPTDQIVSAAREVLLREIESTKGGHPSRPRRRWALIAIAAILVGLLLVTPAFGLGQRLLDVIQGGQDPPKAGWPAWSPDGQKIAFVGLVDAYEIYVMNPDGSGLEKLPGTGSGAFLWSPDGRMILFTSDSRASGSPVSAGLYVVNADGTGRRLITREADLNRPAWSPDGGKIAFMGHEPFTIHIVNADGSGARMLADDAFGPVWSPDGRMIAFSSRRDDAGVSDVYVMNADGSEKRNLTRDPAGDSDPAWSPDGRQIAYLTKRDGNHDIHVVNADGSGQRMLTRDVVPVDVAWSPDGRQIAFVSAREGSPDIYVVNADGSGQRRLTDDAGDDLWPAWSPDGGQIAFVRREDNDDIYVMNADGSGQRKLTHLDGN